MPDREKRRRVRIVDLENPFGEIVDAPLSPLGREQARVVGERLASVAIDAVYCSPLSRARHMGAAVAGHHGPEPVVHEGLTEIDLFYGVPDDKGVLDHYGAERFVELLGERSRSRIDSA